MRDLVYISYSSADSTFRDELREVLLNDIRLRDLVWDDKKIPPGANWRMEIDQHVGRARIMIVMVSDTYLAPACQAWQFEIPQALEALKNNELSILWIPVRRISASATPFTDIHAALPLSKPLDSLNDSQRVAAYLQLKHDILGLLGLDEQRHFDVFLSHNSLDKPAVRQLGEALKNRGLSVWLDEWELIPGRLWQDALEDIITTCSAAIICVGPNGMGPWEDPEMQALLRRFVNEKKQGNIVPVIPVFLAGAPANIKLPMFLAGFMWVDMRHGIDAQGLDRVQWGILGKKPSESTNSGGTKEVATRTSRSHFPLGKIAIYTSLVIVICLLAWMYIPQLFDSKSIRPRDIGFESVLVEQVAKELCQPKEDSSHSVELTRVAFVRNEEKNRFEVTLNADSHEGYIDFVKSVEVQGCSSPIQVRTTFEGKVGNGELRANDKVEIVGRIASITNNGDYYVVIKISECAFKRLAP